MARVNRARSYRVVLAVLLGMAMFVAAACGDDDDSADDAPTEETPSEETPTEETPSEETPTDETPTDDAETVEVRLLDYSFEGLPDEVPAGTQFTVVNESTIELHELVAILLPDDEERSVEELLALPEEEIGPVLGAAEPATVLLAEPDGGPMIQAVGDGTLTEPGRYLIGCFIPVGADPAEYLSAAAESEGGPPEVEGGPPHFVQGMHAELTVS